MSRHRHNERKYRKSHTGPHLRPSEGLIAIRSAARLGYSGLGVNRKRAEQLRALLRQQSAIRYGTGRKLR